MSTFGIIVAALAALIWGSLKYSDFRHREREKRNFLNVAYEWADQHGSERLRLFMEGDFIERVTALYLEERVMSERPGWHYYGYLRGQHESDDETFWKNQSWNNDEMMPTADALMLLAEAQAMGIKAKIVWMYPSMSPACTHILYAHHEIHGRQVQIWKPVVAKAREKKLVAV